MVLCFHLVKCNPFLSLPFLKDQKIAKKKQSKLPPHRDPIITRSRAREMSTNGPSTPEVDHAKFSKMKEKKSELMRMVQQLVVGGGKTLSVIAKEVPKLRMEISLCHYRSRATMYHPRAATKRQILQRTRTPNQGMAKSRAKWKL